MDIRCTYFIRV